MSWQNGLDAVAKFFNSIGNVFGLILIGIGIGTLGMQAILTSFGNIGILVGILAALFGIPFLVGALKK